MTDQLPPLPEPAQEAQSEGYMSGCPTPIPATPDFYTADQMREYARAALAQPAASGEPPMFRQYVDQQVAKDMAPLYAAFGTAQPAASGEPVAWTYMGIKADGTEHGPHLVWMPAYMDAMSASKGAKATPLYAAPQPAPARVPLTEAQIAAIVRETSAGSAIRRDGSTSQRIARAIERAYGIGTPAKEAP